MGSDTPPEGTDPPLGAPGPIVPDPHPHVPGLGYHLSGYKAPEAPVYKGRTVEARRAFVRKYELYMQQCDNYGASIGCKVVPRGIGDCMEVNAKLFAASMQLRRPAHTITNKDWMIWFLAADSMVPALYAEIPERIKKTVIMNETLLDGDERFDDWCYQYWTCLESLNAQSFSTQYAKYAVRALVHGIRPLTVKKVVQDQLTFGEKHIRSNVLLFMDKVKEQLIPACKLERAAAGPPKPRKPDGPGQDKGDAKPTGKFKQLKDPEGGAKPYRNACWGCGGNHSLHDCPRRRTLTRKRSGRRK